MNQHFTRPAQMATDTLWTERRTIEGERFRSLALSLRKHSHRYRQWGREAAEQGHRSAADSFNRYAARYIADAIWYWQRSRRAAVQFNTEDASS